VPASTPASRSRFPAPCRHGDGTAIVVVAVLVVFWPVLDGGFLNWDDDINFLANPSSRGLGWAELRWMWTSVLMGHYIPLTWMSLGLNHVLGGMDPWGYHLGNVRLHAINTAVFYSVARRLLVAGGFSDGAAVWAGAGFAALVFGVHPLRVESVAWITERRDVLCGLFFLLAVLTYLVSRDPGVRRAWPRSRPWPPRSCARRRRCRCPWRW
jgi:hypothetical protein